MGRLLIYDVSVFNVTEVEGQKAAGVFDGARKV